jgi:hypothetical protein
MQGAGLHAAPEEIQKVGTQIEPQGLGSLCGCNTEPSVAALPRSGSHDFAKEVQETVALVGGHVVEDDAHAGASGQHLYDKAGHPTRPNLRQVLLVEEELILELTALGLVSPRRKRTR